MSSEYFDRLDGMALSEEIRLLITTTSSSILKSKIKCLITQKVYPTLPPFVDYNFCLKFVNFVTKQAKCNKTEQIEGINHSRSISQKLPEL